MEHVNKIANLLTEDPDVFNPKTVIIAVHPNYVIDAAQAAASKWASSPEKFGPKRLEILTNYVRKFKRFISNQAARKIPIIVTTMGNPFQLENWHDPDAHWDEEADAVEQGAEQRSVFQVHKDLMDFIYELREPPFFIVVPEKEAGGACRHGKLDHMLKNAEEVVLIGGNLTGCLRNTLEALEDWGLRVRVERELTFDDDPSFWDRE